MDWMRSRRMLSIDFWPLSSATGSHSASSMSVSRCFRTRETSCMNCNMLTSNTHGNAGNFRRSQLTTITKTKELTSLLRTTLSPVLITCRSMPCSMYCPISVRRQAVSGTAWSETEAATVGELSNQALRPPTHVLQKHQWWLHLRTGAFWLSPGGHLIPGSTGYSQFQEK